jgi:hypothetical protein
VLDRLVEVPHCDADMVDLCQHRSALPRRRRRRLEPLDELVGCRHVIGGKR